MSDVITKKEKNRVGFLIGYEVYRETVELIFTDQGEVKILEIDKFNEKYELVNLPF